MMAHKMLLYYPSVANITSNNTGDTPAGYFVQKCVDRRSSQDILHTQNYLPVPGRPTFRKTQSNLDFYKHEGGGSILSYRKRLIFLLNAKFWAF